MCVWVCVYSADTKSVSDKICCSLVKSALSDSAPQLPLLHALSPSRLYCPSLCWLPSLRSAPPIKLQAWPKQFQAYRKDSSSPSSPVRKSQQGALIWSLAHPWTNHFWALATAQLGKWDVISASLHQTRMAKTGFEGYSSGQTTQKKPTLSRPRSTCSMASRSLV